MNRYAKIVDDAVHLVIEAETQPDAQHGEWVLCPAHVGPGFTVDAGRATFTAPSATAPVVPQHATKNAFQSRFPLMPNGVSTKWDAMCLFQVDDGYAASLGVTGAALYGLRMLITTGVQRLNASPFVDMASGAQAAALTLLLTQGSIPADFRLSPAERTAMLETPLADHERYRG